MGVHPERTWSATRVARVVWRAMSPTTKGRCPECGDKKPLLSIQAAAERADVNRKTIYRWIRDGLLPYRRLPSGTIRVSEDDLLRIPRKGRPRRAAARGGLRAETMSIGRSEPKAARGRKHYRGDEE